MTSLADSTAAGTLRSAVNGAASGDSIEFSAALFPDASPKTLKLSSPLVLKRSVTIIGPGDVAGPVGPTPRLRLLRDPVGSGRLLQIQAPAAVVIAGLGFQGGGASSPGGGAALIDAGAVATFQECDFQGNAAKSGYPGGAILNRGSLTLDGCNILSNTAGSGAGVASFGKFQVVRSLFKGNVATGSGGAIASSGADLTVESSTLAGNKAGVGGAVAFMSDCKPGSTAQFTAVTVIDNSASSLSGGLYVEGTGASANLTGSLVTRNSVTTYGCVSTSRDLAVQRCGHIVSRGYNLIGKPGVSLENSSASDQIGVDPLVGALAFNGGRTMTYAIGAGSPARDGGMPGFSGILVNTDQREYARVWPTTGGRADVGAYEFTPGLVLTGPVEIEGTGPTTPASLSASLSVPRGGSAAVVWTSGGVSANPYTVVLPDNGQAQTLSFQGNFPYGITPVAVTVTIGALQLSASTSVNVTDKTPPVLTLPADQLLEATSPLGAKAVYSATAFDLVSGAVPVTFSPVSGNTFGLGITTVTATAVDGAGNPASGTFKVTVRDTIPPFINPFENITVEATGPSGAVVNFAPTATDAACLPLVTTTPVSGSVFPLGTTLVTIFAQDDSGNPASSVFSITVKDTTPPVITAPADIVVEATGPNGAQVNFTASANDLVDGPISLGTSVPSGTVFPLGDTLVQLKATDAAHNESSSTFKITVKDTTPPALTVPSDISVHATVSGGAVVAFTPAALDLVSAATVTSSPASGSVFPVGTTTVSVTAKDAAGNTSSGSFTVTVDDPYGVTLKNVIWPLAADFEPNFVASGNLRVGGVRQMIARPGESRWYKFHGPPGCRIEVTLTQQPANYDVVVYSDIEESYDNLLGLTGPSSSDADKKLALLGAVFAPEAYSPEAYSPEAYSPEAYSPEAYSPEAYSPEAYSPEAYSPEAYSPEAYSPEAYSPEAYSPEAYSPEAYSPEAYSPEAYASAQQRSLIGFSAAPGTSSEGVRFSTYSRSGDFYIRVRGQNGVFTLDAPFTLSVTLQQNLCSGVTDLSTLPATLSPTVVGTPTSLFVWDSTRIVGTSAEKLALASSLSHFAALANGVVVDVSTDAQIAKLNAQADSNPDCVVAKNLVADAIRNLIQRYRTSAPTIADITLLGNDAVIPFFRTDDHAMLASEANYFPPVQDATQSQTSLRYAQVLSQDRYGSASQVALGTGTYDLPELPVGRLVETASEVKTYLDVYATLFNGSATSGQVPVPKSAFVSGYDFLADSAEAMKTDLTTGLGAGATVDSLISPMNQAPVFGWTADQFRAAFLGSRHDISYLAGHFSTSRALAADFSTRVRALEVAESNVNLSYALVMSAGCHSGYSTVDKDAVVLLTEVPDWAQAFSRKQAILIGGTGYQYGDTDFVAYTERLVLEVAKALRTGNGAIPIGKALVAAKRRYLADTAVVRGIDEKTLLELTLYGLPMVKFNLPGARLAVAAPPADIAGVTPAFGGLGAGLGLKTADLSFNPHLTRVDKPLKIVGSPNSVIASYFTGSAGTVTIPVEPIRPLETFNVSRPLDGFVRGVGFRSALYHDLTGFLPFTGAPATETRGVHGRFSSDVFYPIQPWALNQTGELAGFDGISQFNAFPTQFMSDGIDSPTGILRAFDQMHFTVYYCPAYNQVALANPPAINVVASSVSAVGVDFSIDVAATAGVGVQEVWVTYTGLPGSPYYGSWQSLSLTAPSGVAGNGVWAGTLPLASGVDASQLRFLVQAVSGVGVVALNTNFGRYFTPGASTLDGIGVELLPTKLSLTGLIPDSGKYRTTLPVQATLSDSSGNPVAGKRIRFRLGPVTVTAVTGANGVATSALVLGARPDAYTLEAGFAGDAVYQNSNDSRSFRVTKMPTRLTFLGGVFVPNAQPLVVNLRADDGTPLKERTVVFIFDNGVTKSVTSEITDGAGQARLLSSALGSGTYQVSVFFGLPVPLPDGSIAPLSDVLYDGSSASSTVTIAKALKFDNEKAWIEYMDLKSPGATSSNRGASRVEILGSISGQGSRFNPSSILASAKAPTVSASLVAKLSGKTLIDGTILLSVSGEGRRHWQGRTVLNGTAVQLFVDWETEPCEASTFHVWITPASGSGPLYGAVPALLSVDLVLGSGPGEHPVGGDSEIGGASKPWTLQNGTKRSRIPCAR